MRVLTPFPAVSVGCRAHTVADWREYWVEIAEEEGADTTESEVETLLKRAEELL